MTLPRPTPVEAYYTSPDFVGRGVTQVPKKFARMAERARAHSETILALYRQIESFDFYFGASCRSRRDFETADNILFLVELDLKEVLGQDPLITAPLFLSASDSEKKGRIERWCLERSKAVVIWDGGKDTRGKILEDATARLVYNIPVILLVGDEERYQIAKEIHPMRLVGKYAEAYGAHVVRVPAEAAQCLRSILIRGTYKRFADENGWRKTFCINCGSVLEESKIK